MQCKFCGATNAMKSMRCALCAQPMWRNVCGAIYVGNLFGATQVVQPVQCDHCSALYVVQPMMCCDRCKAIYGGQARPQRRRAATGRQRRRHSRHTDSQTGGDKEATGRRLRQHSRQATNQAQATGGNKAATGRRRRLHRRRAD
eukprot:844925-Pyramimonas_sp.AAC.2